MLFLKKPVENRVVGDQRVQSWDIIKIWAFFKPLKKFCVLTQRKLFRNWSKIIAKIDIPHRYYSFKILTLMSK
jgi:hypothetical protein